jgi:hypothetical protein
MPFPSGRLNPSARSIIPGHEGIFAFRQRTVYPRSPVDQGLAAPVMNQILCDMWFSRFGNSHSDDAVVVVCPGEILSGSEGARAAIERFIAMRPVFTIGNRQIIEGESISLHPHAVVAGRDQNRWRAIELQRLHRGRLPQAT